MKQWVVGYLRERSWSLVPQHQPRRVFYLQKSLPCRSLPLRGSNNTKMSLKLKNLHLSWSRSQRRFCQLACGWSDFPLILSCRCSLSCRMFSQCQPMSLFQGYSCRNSFDFLDYLVWSSYSDTYPMFQAWHWGALVLDRCHNLGSEWWWGGRFLVCLQLELQRSAGYNMNGKG